MLKRKLKFEDCLESIDHEINRRRGKWQLGALAWLDFDDVAQILRIHIFKKWHMWNQARELGPWLNVVITHQITNLVRNLYINCSKPCVRCCAAEGENGCRIYATQCVKCPIFAHWKKNKQQAYNLRLPVSLEHHTQEVFDMPHHDMDLEKSIENLHEKMKQVLKPLELKAYTYLFIEHKSEEEAAKLLGYTTSEKGRKVGYRMIKNLRKQIIDKAKALIYSDNVDI